MEENSEARESKLVALTAALASARDGFARFFIGGSATFGFTFIPVLFPAGQRQFDLDPTVLEVHAGGNQSQALLLCFTDQLSNLFLMNQKFSRAQRSVVGIAAVCVRTDMAIQQPEFVVFH